MNILILGSSGKIGSQLSKMLETKHKIFLVDRKNIKKRINKRFDLVINCLGPEIYKNSNDIKRIYNFYSKNIFRSNKFRWLEISTVSVYGIMENKNLDIFEKNKIINKSQFSQYGIDKLNGENILIKYAISRNFKVNIYRFGIIIERDNINEKIKSIFKRFVYFRIFINFFDNKMKLKISFLDNIYKIINSDLVKYKDKSKITTYFEEIDISKNIKNIFKIILPIKINIFLFDKILKTLNINFIIKMKLLFNNNISKKNKFILNKTYTF